MCVFLIPSTTVNRKLKRLRKSRQNLMVIDPELEGFQTLWDIVLHGEAPVFDSALRFLVSLYLHTSLPDSLPDSDGSDEDDVRKSAVEEIRVELVHRSMQHIGIALKSSSAVLAQRCVSVLGSFLDSIPRFGGSVPLQGFSEDESFGIGDVKEGKKVPNARNEILELEMDPYQHIPSPSTSSEREAVASLQVLCLFFFLDLALPFLTLYLLLREFLGVIVTCSSLLLSNITIGQFVRRLMSS